MGEREFDALLEAAGEAIGGDNNRLEQLNRSNPALAKLIGSMKKEDAQKLLELVGDREKTRRMLATPQAQKLLRSLKKEGQETDG